MKRLGKRLGVALGWHGGFIASYRYAKAARLRAGEGYPELEEMFRRREAAFAEILDNIAAHEGDFAKFSGQPPSPRFAQEWFPPLDGAAAYAIVRKFRPKRIVEAGGGHSTRFFQRALKDGGISCEHTVIDPGAKAARKIAGLGVTLIARPLEEAGIPAVRNFAANDVLSLDGSHIAWPGSDVDMLVNRMLTHLPAGALVQVHDVFLPDPYPKAWQGRCYNEQGVIAALLQGRGFDIVFASRYAASRMRGQIRGLPVPPGNLDSSLWLRKSASF